MATTFSVVAFKNATLDALTGVAAAPSPFASANPYNGAQAANPDTAPAGSFEFVANANAPALTGTMVAAVDGISVISGSIAPVSPGSALATASITTVRISDASDVGLVDVVASVSGGGGGIILDSLTAVVAVGSTIEAFSFSLPLNNGGTVKVNSALATQLVALWCSASGVSPKMGINTSGGCVLNLYESGGSPPSTADAAAVGTLLASITIGASNIWAAASGGSVALAANPSVLASASGTADYARLVKTYGTETFVIQGSAGLAATDFVFDYVTLVSGVTTVTLTEATISL